MIYDLIKWLRSEQAVGLHNFQRVFVAGSISSREQISGLNQRPVEAALSEGFEVSNVLHRGELGNKFENRAALERAAMSPPAVDEGPLASDVLLYIVWVLLLFNCHVCVPWGFSTRWMSGARVSELYRQQLSNVGCFVED